MPSHERPATLYNAGAASMTTDFDTGCAGSYARYEKWKAWDNPFRYGADDAAYFRKEFRGVDFGGKRVLEIGFGEGRFLSWAVEQGAVAYGTELIPAMRLAAERFGVQLLPERLADAVGQFEAAFDLIVALDVAEHWTLEGLAEQIDLIEKLLRPGGLVVLRFPNGQSPFGLLAQAGDPTHRSALSRAVFESLLVGHNLKVVRYAAQARFFGRNPMKATIRSARYCARMFINATLNFIYASDIPWDGVVTLVLQRSKTVGE